MDFFIKAIYELCHFDFNYIMSAKFWGYGVLVFFIMIPFAILIVAGLFCFLDFIIDFVFDYQEYKAWKISKNKGDIDKSN